jgi:polysaccharide export outer membrane protein
MKNQTFRTLRALALAALVLFVALPPTAGQTRQQPQVKPPPSTSAEPNTAPGILVATDQDYRIGARDVIEVRIEDANELSGTYQINADGTFLMPYLKRIKAQDKTPEELSTFIADGLRDRYLKDPQVMVAVKQFYSRTFFIQGAVNRPGVYQMEGHPSLLKLINVAGGLADNHGSTAFIIREAKNKKTDSLADARGKTTQAASLAANQPSQAAGSGEEDLPEYTLKTVNISGLFMGSFEQNTFVEPGDIVNIPKADVFFVAGEVKAPGQFVLRDGTTLRQALALSQGATSNAKMGDGIIMRTDPATGKREEIHVDIGAVMRAKKDDIVILANDIVIVGNSRAKTVGNTILKAFGMSAAQRGIIPF